ncbi:MucBP domain-containing protein [Lacticaseibacillus baoqingensis]|uniref:MucBP domain-containing protein n=1 Tax=Lacticaseibacillus baoqingensis TaxID=2486013 RepID=A0ABW4E540_9LACO|nr:MucBP domain-containing protein [Lacticaseibacillus baoqingensis]
MSFFSRIKTWLRPTAAKSQPKQPRPPKKPAAVHTSPAPKPLAPATGAVDSQVHVVVSYLDTSTHQALLPPAQLVGHPGDALPIAWRVVAGYVLTEIKGFTQVFPKNNQVIVCGYSARVAGPVVVYHRDTHGRLLQAPELLTGVINQVYTAHALSQFKAAVVGPADQTGTFSPISQRLKFIYQLTPLEAGALPDATYIELLAPKTVFAEPLSEVSLPTKLPRHTYWQVYAVMRDPNTHTVWLNVGGNQWLTAENTRDHAHNPFLPDPTPLALPHSLFTSTETPLRLTGITIGEATRWSAPYATIKPARLAANTAVKLTALATLSNGSRWYRLADGDYVLATFITLT